MIQRLAGRVGRSVATRPGAFSLVALLALLAASGCDTSQVTEPILTGVVWTRITDSSAVQIPFYPSWRGDSIAFEYFNTDGKSRLAVVHESGTGLRFLPGGPYFTNDRAPRWVAADMIVFTASRSGTSFDIWYITPSTGTVRRITSTSTQEWDPDPRPGSPGIVFTDGPLPQEGRITVVPDTADVPVQRIYLTPDTLKAGEPVWNPAGDRICFSADSADGSRHLWLASLAPGDTTVTQITVGPVHDYSPQWSPDGTRIYFTSDRTNRSGVWWVSPAGEANGLDVVAFEDPGALISTLAVSPDGTRIVVSSDGRNFGRSLWVLSNLP